ncbi:MAG: hypothetical protein RLZZ488_582 [Pseudomonadota bacterium]|jgi:hypothetical protein
MLIFTVARGLVRRISAKALRRLWSVKLKNLFLSVGVSLFIASCGRFVSKYDKGELASLSAQGIPNTGCNPLTKIGCESGDSTGINPAVVPVQTAAPSPEATSSPSPEATASPKPTASPSPEATASPKPTASPSPKPTVSPSPSPSKTPCPDNDDDHDHDDKDSDDKKRHR